ncbi:TIGR01620 family protein [Shewanella sp. 1_MG-2023]|uniref:TIGR01620 family protein n=1 Tax=unclassified Shewanella TaxID=196818 RepID=UPI0026E1614C|nr:MULTISPECIES: TIGR01620 family protein [unclassified Shewanella]MDO6612200.1 TIGR01620 family protein [Shewanella sp. 7_MG-2023]MDO6772054.1 TIGR01620 family protein [Shewanella sp. 2_MG-2023]MDO6795794.1 TIGR01620 family protein [Shewanella sp. 1_MG-2023]
MKPSQSHHSSDNESMQQTKLKQQQVFASETTEEPQVKPSQSYAEVEFQCELALAEIVEDIDVIEPTRSAKRWSPLAKLSLVGISLAVIVQTLLGLHAAFLQSPWLFGFYASVTGVILAWVSTITLAEWRKLVKLKHVADTQVTGERLSQSMQRGEAEKFISPLLSQYPESEGKQQYSAMNTSEHNDAEMVLLFDDLVVSERDEKAKQIVSRYAAESALLLAASPLAVLDMAIILWRNQRMINAIADIYGIELGYWSRIKLIKSIIVNIVYAGTTEVVADLGTQLLSVEMTGKLSARLAQGLGGGLLTARLGYQAMTLCRPLSFKEQNRPKLGQIHQQLLTELKTFSASMMQKSKVKSASETHKD